MLVPLRWLTEPEASTAPGELPLLARIVQSSETGTAGAADSKVRSNDEMVEVCCRTKSSPTLNGGVMVHELPLKLPLLNKTVSAKEAQFRTSRRQTKNRKKPDRI